MALRPRVAPRCRRAVAHELREAGGEREAGPAGAVSYLWQGHPAHAAAL